MSSHEKPREAWAITGSGHYLKECLDLVQQRPDVDLFLSKAAAEVLPMYDFDLKSIRQQITCFRDTTASASPVGLFYQGRYRRLVIAPATSNTIAKMVWGIADTLVTNIYAQAGKCRIPSIVFACDTEPEMETEAPGGMVMVYPRQIDLENVKRLEDFEYTSVVTSFDQLLATLEDLD
ncbi:MAG: flavoprotein [gamma proteobacterium symbiont of Ctena orbiculata]|nr:flavoprotein [Candidatus Thiodiazotropha taylori]MBT3058406.1 flavoprotein [Candidatus Thiodiazotropha sp. (ex Lucina pensylvanica)]MBT3061460.1 flavoprotein [Candidatus Thiodiazotropha sp. (ex Lucina pensylvanica)]PUB74765.1 MAG: flavoprotein [gamma proteobacterium symbiont of Ctena orbiculata]PUB76950.1 MAG: flavoprotein [gamma proteobacterium symbiont of Ctena orbiculata]